VIAAPRRRRGETRCFVHIDVRAHRGVELAAMGGVALAIVAAVFLASDLSHAATEILVMTGDAAVDGTRLDSISAPSAGGDSAIFLGGTSAVLTVSGGVTTLVARTGDPLPAPLDGTFNRLASRVAINDRSEERRVGKECRTGWTPDGQRERRARV